MGPPAPMEPPAPTPGPTPPPQTAQPTTGAKSATQPSNFSPSPLQSLTQIQNYNLGDLVNSITLHEPIDTVVQNESPTPTLKHYTLADLSNNITVAQSQTHPGYSGTIATSSHPGDFSGGNMPQGYDPKQNYGNFLGGQCTSYASWYWSNVLGKQFIDAGGNGNASNWPALAREQGYTVNATPRVNDIVSWPDMGQYGHVGIVSGVNPDGTISVSEMNYSPGKYTTRSNVSASGAQFIR